MNAPLTGNYEDYAPLFANHEAIVGTPFNPRQNQSKQFYMVPHWLFNRPEVPLQAAVLYGILVYKCDPRTGIAKSIGARKLAKMMKFKNDKSVRNYINLLKDLGLIFSNRQGDNTANEYGFLIHDWMLDSNE